MRYAVTYDNGQIFQHFGRTEHFKLYDVADGKITAAVVVDANGSSHGALAGFLQENHVDTLVCGGIGDGAKQALEQAGIALFGGVTGDADSAVNDLLADRLVHNPDVRCSHHDHGEDHHHTCG